MHGENLAVRMQCKPGKGNHERTGQQCGNNDFVHCLEYNGESYFKSEYVQPPIHIKVNNIKGRLNAPINGKEINKEKIVVRANLRTRAYYLRDIIICDCLIYNLWRCNDWMNLLSSVHIQIWQSAVNVLSSCCVNIFLI